MEHLVGIETEDKRGERKLKETIQERIIPAILVALCLPFMVSITYRVIPLDEPVLDGIAELRREVMYMIATTEDEPDDGAAIVESLATTIGTVLTGHGSRRSVEPKTKPVRTDITEAESESELDTPAPAEVVATEPEPAEIVPDFERDVDIVAVLIFNEGWCETSLRHKEMDGAVVYNRLNSDQFPNTVYEIVTAQGQYHPAYANPDSIYSQAARADPEIWATCREIARRALSGEVDCPADVVFQAEEPQGKGIYEIHYTSYSTTYFCYG